MKKAVLVYGLCGGVLIAALKFVEYRFLVVVVREVPVAAGPPFVRNEATVSTLGVINAAITFMEPFPVGLVVALVSAGVLRRKAV